MYINEMKSEGIKTKRVQVPKGKLRLRWQRGVKNWFTQEESRDFLSGGHKTIEGSRMIYGLSAIVALIIAGGVHFGT